MVLWLTGSRIGDEGDEGELTLVPGREVVSEAMLRGRSLAPVFVSQVYLVDKER